jgi:hypothetical protein
MRAISKRRRLAFLLGVAAVVALLGASAAYALTAKSFRYDSPKIGYVRVHNMAFAPFNLDDNYTNSWPNGLFSGLGACLNAGVDLPPGSRVKAITFYFKSNTSSDLFGVLMRRRLSTGGATELARATPVNDANTPTSVTVNVPGTKQAVTADHAFGVGVCPGTDNFFYGARIKYTYTSAGS